MNVYKIADCKKRHFVIVKVANKITFIVVRSSVNVKFITIHLQGFMTCKTNMSRLFWKNLTYAIKLIQKSRNNKFSVQIFIE